MFECESSAQLVVIENQRVCFLYPGNMASFEVEMLIREVPSDGKITFVLKYNPIGEHRATDYSL